MTTEKASVIKLFSGFRQIPELEVSSGLSVTSPGDGTLIASLAPDNDVSVNNKIVRSAAAQFGWGAESRAVRAAFLEALSATVKQQRVRLAELIVLEAGKSTKEALVEADGFADTLIKTIKDASLADFTGMQRVKERPPVGVVGLITSFNFPLVVAGWTLAPALLAGNSVVWKPSEKTPLVALALKAIFDEVAGQRADLLQVLIGGREIGADMVAHEHVDMISATGSVAMGRGIRAALAKKTNHSVKPVLELGGNNAVIISEHVSDSHLEFAVSSIMNSFLGTTGQRCTNTRRLIVHTSLSTKVTQLLQAKIQAFLASSPIENPVSGIANDYGYGPLIDADAYQRFVDALEHAKKEGGSVIMGRRIKEQEAPQAYYVEPALALMTAQTSIMHEETFAPLLYVVPYSGSIVDAMILMNAPDNAGLVNGIYTLSKQEAAYFSSHNQAGHSVINSPKGTGTPAFGMGFGGNKASGEGEILNAADPLRAFTRDTTYHRIAINAEIPLDRP